MSNPTTEAPLDFSRPHEGSWFQIGRPFDFEWNRVTLPVPNLPPDLAGFRIIHLTDLHLRAKWHAAYDVLLGKIRDASADLLLFTGDFVDNKRDHTDALPNVYRMAAGLTARHGAFAIVGNHDGPTFGPRLAATPVEWISGQRRTIVVGDATVELIGLPGCLRRDLPPEFAGTMPAKSEDGRSVRIVLSHYPDHLRLVGDILRPELFLAGHTHGGQVCLPGGVPIIKHDALPRKLCTGIHRVGDTWLVVPRGFGATTLPLRIFCPPEVVEIELAAG